MVPLVGTGVRCLSRGQLLPWAIASYVSNEADASVSTKTADELLYALEVTAFHAEAGPPAQRDVCGCMIVSVCVCVCACVCVYVCSGEGEAEAQPEEQAQKL
jgi:hypothetical protein